MKDVYFTIAGVNHYYGSEFMKKGMEIKLIKEPDNKYDHEAIRCEISPLGKVGYVANSTNTVLGECMSAGRIYDRFGKKTIGKVVMVLPQGIICKLKNKK